MKSYDIVELAARNLKESVLRNSLTTIGIAVGVASLVAMLSLGVGLQQMATKRLERSGLFDTVMVSPRVDVRGVGRMQIPALEDRKPLDDKARHELEQLPNVAEVYPGIRAMAEVNYGGKTHASMISGLPMSARERDAFESMQGKFFSGPEAEEAILQNEFAREIDPTPQSLIGKEITLRYARRQTLAGAAAPLPLPFAGFSVVPTEQKLRVVGITEQDPEGAFGGFGRGRVYIPVQFAEKLEFMQITDMRDALRSSTGYMSLIVRVKDPKYVEAVEDAVKKMGFSSFSLLDATRSMRRFFAIIDLFLGIFGSVALAVASLGIVNTLVMAILERRREIGIMKAIGADNGDVKKLFFAEAGVMGLVGGGVGVLLGWLIGRAVNFGTNVYLRSQNVPGENFWSVPWWLVAGAIGFSILVSLGAGLYPAARAAKLDPVQSLRWE